MTRSWSLSSMWIELLNLALEHPRNRDAGPFGDDLRDVLRLDLLLQHLHVLLKLGQRSFSFSKFFEAHAIFRTSIRPRGPSPRGVPPGRPRTWWTRWPPWPPDLGDGRLLVLPVGLELGRFLLEGRDSSFSIFCRRSAEALSVSFLRACFSTSNCRMRRST
jgi:hypothetical protein